MFLRKVQRNTSLSTLHHVIKQNPRSRATKTPKHLNNIMILTKSVRELAADINAAPDNYDSNDEVSDKCLFIDIEAEFEAAGLLCHKGEGTRCHGGQTGKRMRPSHW